MVEQIGVCYVCQRTGEILDRHHIWPQHAGGENGPLVDLCPTCHSGIHRQAVNLYAKKAQRKRYFPPDQMQRAKPLIQYLVMAMQQTAERQIEGREVKVMVELPENLALALHMLKAQAGRKSLSKFCVEVLQAFARSRL